MNMKNIGILLSILLALSSLGSSFYYMTIASYVFASLNLAMAIGWSALAFAEWNQSKSA